MRKLKIYTIGKKSLVWSGNVKNVYDSNFYFRTMPTLSEKRCKQILNVLYPHFKAECQTLVFEWVDNGYTGTQELYRKGTILNF